MTLRRSQVVDALQHALKVELEAVERVAAMARDEATSSETKAEGKYDTRATEASYLARGQAQRIASLRQLDAWYDRLDPHRVLEHPCVCLGALVELLGEQKEWVFLAPTGGATVRVGGHRIRVISLSSPLGEALAELEPGDGAEVDSPRGLLDYEVLTVL